MSAPECAARQHGDANAYDHYGCRCLDAVRAKMRRQERNRYLAAIGTPTTIDAIGARRRLQALACMGWGLTALAAETGIYWNHLYSLRSGRRVRMWRPTGDAIRVVYDRVADRLGPDPRAITWARKHGWAPPICWDDDTIDDPDAQPDYGTKVPRQQALYEDACELLAQDLSREHVAQRLGIAKNYLELVLRRGQREEGAA